MLHLEMVTCLSVTKNQVIQALEGRSFLPLFQMAGGVPSPTVLAHQLFGLSLMLSLSFLHLLSFSSLLSLVNLVTEKQEVHFLLT